MPNKGDTIGAVTELTKTVLSDDKADKAITARDAYIVIVSTVCALIISLGIDFGQVWADKARLREQEITKEYQIKKDAIQIISENNEETQKIALEALKALNESQAVNKKLKAELEEVKEELKMYKIKYGPL